MAVKVRFTMGIKAVVGWGTDVGRLEEVDVDGSSRHVFLGEGGSESTLSDSGSDSGRLLTIGLPVLLTTDNIKS